jgi:Fe2+ or Zn2+ uptake regulation protein
MFEELPGACLNWINDHPSKSELLLKVLSILHELSKEEKGVELLTQYEALEFLEEFRKHMTVRETNVEVAYIIDSGVSGDD